MRGRQDGDEGKADGGEEEGRRATRNRREKWQTGGEDERNQERQEKGQRGCQKEGERKWDGKMGKRECRRRGRVQQVKGGVGRGVWVGGGETRF